MLELWQIIGVVVAVYLLVGFYLQRRDGRYRCEGGSSYPGSDCEDGHEKPALHSANSPHERLIFGVIWLPVIVLEFVLVRGLPAVTRALRWIAIGT